jgi:hypothetical protein
MKKILALIPIFFSIAGLGQSLKFEPKFDLGFDWMPITSESIDRIYFDKYNLSVKNNKRRYLVLINSSRFSIETDCEKMESKILSKVTIASPLSNLPIDFNAVKDNLQFIAKYACAV